jgi:hypothetical protein
MPRHKSETALAWLTLFGTAVHFVLETWYHLVWGQPLQALLVDYICVALMVSGGIASLKARPGSAAGLLAAGWAFALGFGWRSVFGRLQLREAGQAAANGEAGWVVFIILGALAVVAIVLIWALWLAWQQAGLIGKNEAA